MNWSRMRGPGKIILLVSFLMVCAGDGWLHGQDKSKYYTVTHPKEFSIDWIGFYNKIDALTAATRKTLPHRLNLAYGRDPKQKLDLYFPKEKPQNAPVFLFLHGGGFREGDRAHYGYIARPFAAHGIITAVASYRLTVDGFHYPDQPHDVENALGWLFRNIASYGGNPQRMYVGGHSAGAILSAEIGVDRSWMRKKGIPSEALRGIAPVSGPYDLRIGGYRERKGETSAYASTEALRAEASPILHVNDPVPLAVVAVGSTENYVDSSRQLVDTLKKKGCRAQLIVLQGQKHNDTALSAGDGDSPLVQAILSMIKQGS